MLARRNTDKRRSTATMSGHGINAGARKNRYCPELIEDPKREAGERAQPPLRLAMGSPRTLSASSRGPLQATRLSYASQQTNGTGLPPYGADGKGTLNVTMNKVEGQFAESQRNEYIPFVHPLPLSLPPIHTREFDYAGCHIDP